MLALFAYIVCADRRSSFFGIAGDFVKAHNLQERDMLTLYRDAHGSYVRDIGNLVKQLLISYPSCLFTY